MNDTEHDTETTGGVDDVIYDYLEAMLREPAAGVSAPVASPLGVSTRREPRPSPAPAPKVRQSAPEVVSRSLLKRPALLTEALFRVPAPPQGEPEPIPEPLPPAPVTAPEPDPVPSVDVHPSPASAATPTSESPSSPARSVEPAQEPIPTPRPAWAQSRFECLIFKVDGLQLAVPLVCLGAVHQIDRRFHSLPGQHDWFLGILQTGSGVNIKVLDTGVCVMPERYNPASRGGLAYVITLHGFDWGLACHSIEKSITLEPEQVKWRTQRGKRPWLAGTVVEHMCSLVDTAGFTAIINAHQPDA